MTSVQSGASASATLSLSAAAGCTGTNPTHASTTMVGGQVKFENDSYRITMDDNNTVHIQNKTTGEDYNIWGDPHVNVDGEHAFDFWGKTTFVLDDGTKVTIDTTPWQGGQNGATVASKVTITSGDYAVQVTGIDSNTHGDLAFEEGAGWGGLVDALTPDGNTLYENTWGKGFLGIDGQGRLRQVDQQLINETDLKKGGALQSRFADALRQLDGLLSVVMVGVFLGDRAQRKSEPKPAPMPAPFVDGWALDARQGADTQRRHRAPLPEADAAFALVVSLHAAANGWYRPQAV